MSQARSSELVRLLTPRLCTTPNCRDGLPAGGHFAPQHGRGGCPRGRRRSPHRARRAEGTGRRSVGGNSRRGGEHRSHRNLCQSPKRPVRGVMIDGFLGIGPGSTSGEPTGSMTSAPYGRGVRTRPSKPNSAAELRLILEAARIDIPSDPSGRLWQGFRQSTISSREPSECPRRRFKSTDVTELSACAPPSQSNV
jgi:hypothetical protein